MNANLIISKKECPELIEELKNLILDTNPIRLMLLIIDLEAAASDTFPISTDERRQLAVLHHLLAEAARLQ